MGEEQSQWRNLGDAEFRSMFLKAASGQPDDADAFFGKFKYVSDLQQGSYSAALDQGILLLEKMQANRRERLS